MKLIKAILALLFFLALPALAQEQPTLLTTPQPPIPDGAVIIANVNLYEAQIVSQDNNKLKISFDINNADKDQNQANIKYGVQLKKIEGEAQTIIAEQVYSKLITLQPNQTISKTINYTAPEYLTGEYQVWVYLKNQKNLPLGQGVAGNIKLEGNNNYLELKDCQTQIKEDPTQTKYPLNQGAYLEKDQNLEVICKVINHFQTPIEFTPEIKIYSHSIYGDLLKTKIEKDQFLTIDPEETKDFQLTLPQTTKAQSYQTTLSLKDKANQVISNQPIFQYSVAGTTATIQNIRLNKDYFKNQETAIATLAWSASDPTKTKVIIEIGQDKKLCGSLTRQLTKKDQLQTTLNIPITTDCLNPTVIATLKDLKNNVLDKTTFKLTSKNPQPSQVKNSNKTILSPVTLALISIIILLLVILLLALIKKRPGMLMLLGLIVIGGVWGGEAKGVTWSRSACDFDFTASVSIAKDIYASYEEMEFPTTITATRVRNDRPDVAAEIGALVDGEDFHGLDTNTNGSSSFVLHSTAGQETDCNCSFDKKSITIPFSQSLLGECGDVVCYDFYYLIQGDSGITINYLADNNYNSNYPGAVKDFYPETFTRTGYIGGFYKYWVCSNSTAANSCSFWTTDKYHPVYDKVGLVTECGAALPGGGDCPVDCTCAANTCTGDTCFDGCGGTCNGTKPCNSPTLSFSVSPTEIGFGDPAILTWDVQNAVSCTASNVGQGEGDSDGWWGFDGETFEDSNWLGVKASSNGTHTQLITPTEIADWAYTLACTSVDGLTTTKTADLSVIGCDPPCADSYCNTAGEINTTCNGNVFEVRYPWHEVTCDPITQTCLDEADGSLCGGIDEACSSYDGCAGTTTSCEYCEDNKIKQKTVGKEDSCNNFSGCDFVEVTCGDELIKECQSGYVCRVVDTCDAQCIPKASGWTEI